MLKLNMRARTLQLSAALFATATASGCATTQPNVSPSSGSEAFGVASQQTFDAQIKNPNPVYDHRMVSSGDRASQAIERYRTDTVKQPTTVRTSNLAIGGSSSDSSSSAGSSPSSTSPSVQAEMAVPTSAKSKSAKGLSSPSPVASLTPVAGGAIDPVTGKFYPAAGPNGYTDPVTGQFIPTGKPPLDTGAFIPAAGGAIDPTTGKFYPSAGANGYTDPVTGQFIPKKP